MRKTFNFTLTAMIMAFVFTMSSCNSEDLVSERQNTALPEYTNQTLQDLEKFNQTFEASKETVQTRSGIWRFFRKVAQLASADASGASKAIKNNSHLCTIGLSINRTFGTVVTASVAVIGGVKASFASKKKEESEELAPEDADALYNNSVDYLIDKMKTENDSVYLHPGSVNSLTDSINVPSSMDYLKHIGQFHNEVLSRALEMNNDYCHPNDNPVMDEADDGDDSQLSSEIEEFFMDDSTKIACDESVSDVIDCCYSTGFDYNENLNQYPFDSQNVTSTYRLFFSALQSAQSTSDVITLVNGYISIIETNNEFSDQEKEQLYCGMIVAVYSYSLWLESLMDEMLVH